MNTQRCIRCERKYQPGQQAEAGFMCDNCLWCAESEDIVRRSDTPADFGDLADEVEQMGEADLEGCVKSELSAE